MMVVAGRSPSLRAVNSTTGKHNNSSPSSSSYGPEILLPVEDIIGITAAGVACLFLAVLLCFCGFRFFSTHVYGRISKRMRQGRGLSGKEGDEERKPLVSGTEWEAKHSILSDWESALSATEAASMATHSGGMAALEYVVRQDGGRGADVVSMGDIEVKGIVGRGSYADVFHGLWFGTDVAIKRVPRGREELFDAFRGEAQLLSGLRHPNVLQLIGVAVDDAQGDLCIITEYMSRGSLHSVVHDESLGALEWRVVRKMLVGACKGMVYLHTRIPQIVHRDLKPQNLLVDEHWKCKVCDFGLATQSSAEAMSVACGTPSYSAPEVLRREKYSEKADVYSFAMVMWEAITRSHPYKGMPPFHISFLVGTEGERPTIPHTIPRAIGAIIEQCWQQDPADRPAFTEVLTMLKGREVVMMEFKVQKSHEDDDERSPPPTLKDDGGGLSSSERGEGM